MFSVSTSFSLYSEDINLTMCFREIFNVDRIESVILLFQNLFVSLMVCSSNSLIC